MLSKSAEVLILDDHVIIRRGLRNLISSRISGIKVHDVASLHGLFERLNGGHLPDVLILDLQLADGNALERLEELRTRWPSLRILVYSMNMERVFGPRVLGSGCAGYLSKDSSEEEVVHALKTVLNGNTYIGLETELRMLERNGDRNAERGANPFERLSSRELGVLDELLAGVGVTEIAERLGLSVSTVATYKARLFDKLGIVNLLELQATARANGYPRA